jgi:hypothetical protein
LVIENGLECPKSWLGQQVLILWEILAHFAPSYYIKGNSALLANPRKLLSQLNHFDMLIP